MTGAKLIVMYPQPKNVEMFEKLYREQQVPLVVEKMCGKTLISETRIIASPMGPMPHYRIAEVHFPSREALETCLASPGGQQTVANAIAISSGGVPVFLIAEEETLSFSQKWLPACSQETPRLSPNGVRFDACGKS